MAIYHLSIKTVGRSEGRSAAAAAAYRSGGKIADQASGLTFDYTRKQGVEHAEIVLATNAARQDINCEAGPPTAELMTALSNLENQTN